MYRKGCNYSAWPVKIMDRLTTQCNSRLSLAASSQSAYCIAEKRVPALQALLPDIPGLLA